MKIQGFRSQHQISEERLRNIPLLQPFKENSKVLKHIFGRYILHTNPIWDCGQVNMKGILNMKHNMDHYNKPLCQDKFHG